MLRDFRKPLVMHDPQVAAAPQAAVSTLAEFIGDSHFKRILSDPIRLRTIR